MNILSGPCASICCENGNTLSNPGGNCYWNVSFSSEETTFPKTFDPTWAWTLKPNDLLPRDNTPCPNDVICYSDCMTGANISTYLFEKSIGSINDELNNNGLTCRLDAENYCFKSYATNGPRNVTSVCKTFLDLMTNIKLSSDEVSYAYVARSLYLYVMSISLPFLLGTFIIYTIIPELMNIQGLLIRSYISCCFVYFLTLVIFASDAQWTLNTFMMILFHFALLGTYFWLNVMCFDIWWAFRFWFRVSRSLNKYSNDSYRKKYIIYSIYAWGVPLLLIGVYLILGFNPEIMMTTNDNQIWLIYLKTLPLSIVLASNICFFALTIININRHNKASRQSLEGSESQRFNSQKRIFYIYLRLFILMGMSYIAQILPFVVQAPIHKYMLFILELPNFAQGPIIFILFVWNNRIKRAVGNRLKYNDWVGIQWIARAALQCRTFFGEPQVL